MENLPLDIVNNILLIKYDEALKQFEQLKKKYLYLKEDNEKMGNYMNDKQVDMCEECGIYDDTDYIDYIEEYERCLCEECFRSFQK
jgi:hypothetical protein